jgi:HTH-type transcriptional regulator, transcriptional repressor of NAD biosynthesis genes
VSPKIVLYGPESSGKTTLAKALALHYGSVWVPEYARYYLLEQDRHTGRLAQGIVSTYADIAPMALGQIALEDSLAEVVPPGRPLFCDTSPLTNLVYSRYYFGQAPDWLEREAPARSYALYLLLRPEVPWVPDPLRDRPADREALFGHFRAALVASGQPFAELAGDAPTRLARAREAVEAVLAT